MLIADIVPDKIATTDLLMLAALLIFGKQGLNLKREVAAIIGFLFTLPSNVRRLDVALSELEREAVSSEVLRLVKVIRRFIGIFGLTVETHLLESKAIDPAPPKIIVTGGEVKP